MKKTIGFALLASAALFPLTGCTAVTSAQGGLTPATGEAWYTKDKYVPFVGLIYDSSVYYCKKDSDQCQKAQLVDAEGGPAAQMSAAMPTEEKKEEEKKEEPKEEEKKDDAAQ